jgi:hypothetical protein
MDEWKLLLVLLGLLLVLGVFCEPFRKAIGLLLVILGFIECLTIAGLIIGVPSMLIGGSFLFAK